MKKMKRIMAVLLAAVMMLAMTTTAFASTGKATIKVNNADNAELSYVQIIEEDRAAETGWKFSDRVLAEFQKVPAYSEMTEQAIMSQLIEDAKTDTVSDAYRLALSNVAANIAHNSMENPQHVTSAGVYSVKATEPGFTYNNMAAYVGFGENHPSIDGVEAVIEAKKQPTDVTKSEDDEDNVVAIGDIVTYTIETVVPSINPNDTNKTFGITDTIEGADYYLTGKGAVARITMMSGQKPMVVGGAEKFVVTENAFSIDLSELINDTNSNAGNKIIVTYTAKVTDVTVDNKAGGHVGGSEVDSDTTNLYTAEIKVIKKDAEDGKKLLKDAGFKLYKVENGKNVYATFDENNKFAGWVDTKEAGTEVFTNEKGEFTVEGFNIGTYWLEETTAPEGYSITDPVEVKITQNGEASAIISVSKDVVDTKLASLPGTGGIGTTIFTVGGCAIMIAAAAFFFLSRKKENK